MNTPLPSVLITDRDQFHVRRAWPRSSEHVLLELNDTDGATVAGQWFADPKALGVALEATPGAHPLGQALIQPAGADAKLKALRAILRSPGTQLVSHRASRRAVVRHVTGSGRAVGYTKVVRPSRAQDLARRGRVAAELLGAAARLPQLQGTSDLTRGVLSWDIVDGSTLSDLGRQPTWTPSRATTAWEAAGAVVAALHASDGQHLEAAHGPRDELRAIDTWLTPAVALRLLDSGLVARARARVSNLLTEDSTGSPMGVLHRDLHDKQLLLDDAGRIGLIDVDTLAHGERALDIANVLVHLELRELQGHLAPEAAVASRHAFMASVGAGAVSAERIEAYAWATRLRLAGVYSFRPQWRDVAAMLLLRTAGSR